MTTPANPTAPPRPRTPPLVGRSRELALLRDQLAAALAGEGGLVLVGGEAGIGKTALLAALGREAAQRGALVVAGACYDLTDTPPYGPWAELLGHHALHTLGDLPPLSAPLATDQTGPPIASQAALFARARDYLAAAAARRPLVLLLDDLHWADPASLDLLRYLARQAAALPLLLVAAYRPEDVTRRHPLYALLPALVREAAPLRLDLPRLAPEDVRALVRARHPLDERDEARLLAFLEQRAEGNPFFLGELLRTLEEEGTLRRDMTGWQLGDLAGLRVPRLLRQVIEGRLDRLGDEDQRLLAVAAVIGQEVPLDLWAAVAEADEGALLDVAERASEARLVEETRDGQRVRFAHALIREALYEGLAPSRRRGWHRRVGEALLAAAQPDPDAVADHFQRAGDGRAAEWLVRAGDRAQRAWAFETAVERYERAEALLAERADTGGNGPGCSSSGRGC